MQTIIPNIVRTPFSVILSLFRPKKLRRFHSGELSNHKTISIPEIPSSSSIGIIAGNGMFPLLFTEEAKARGYKVYAVCHELETDPKIESVVDGFTWIKLGQLGSLIQFFKKHKLQFVVMAGGISRVKHFGDVKLDMRGTALLLKLRSTKDDVIMRGIADELSQEGIEVIPCTIFMKDSICPLGVLTSTSPNSENADDIDVGVEALKAMSSQDIGQLVVVREGTVVAVEAIEGSNEAIKRGAALGGKGTVVVKCAKLTQDMRFDVPTVGMTTMELLRDNHVRVLALEAGRSIIIEKEACIQFANDHGIVIVGIPPIIKETLG